MDAKLELIIQSREKDLGGFTVRRLLPYATHRMVGPFIFFDHMGPAEFKPGDGLNVRPHPHIGLATVTYLFDGKILHRDSLGSEQFIEPGAINWMTAGKGIVHSERTPEDLKKTGYKMNGIQCWVALPDSKETMEPNFSHHPKETLPEFSIGKARLKLLLGNAFGHQSPVPVHSDLFYLEAFVPAGASFDFDPSEGRESAVYVVKGQLRVENESLGDCTMAVARKGQSLRLEAQMDSHLMLLGGVAVGPRYIWWNLVASTETQLENAKALWKKSGPHLDSPLFPPIPGDNQEYIPAPEEMPHVHTTKGTIL